MILRELIKSAAPVVTQPPDTRISKLTEIMRREGIGSIVIVDNEQVAGIITDRDIAMALALGAATSDSFASEVMSWPVKTIKDNMSLFDVARFFRLAQVKRLPVVDEHDRLVGIVSTDDLLAVLSREIFETCASLEPKLRQQV